MSLKLVIVVFSCVWIPLFAKELIEPGSDITLRTCCQLQSLLLNGTCGNSSSSINDNGPFKEFVSIGGDLLPSNSMFPNNSSVNFRLSHQSVSCSNGNLNITISVSSGIKAFLTVNGLRDDDGSVVFLPHNGFIKYGHNHFDSDHYCFNRIQNDVLEINVCNPACSKTEPCITKCCNMDEVWDLSRYPDGPLKCSPSGEKRWSPKLYSSVGSKTSEPLDNIKPHVISSHPKFWCTAPPVIHTLKSLSKTKKKLFKVLVDGTVWLKMDRKQWTELAPGTFCIDGAKGLPVDSVSENWTSSFYSGNYLDTIIVDCGSGDQSSCIHRGPSNLYGIMLIAASVFLLVTVIVYILLWEKQNIHGWTSLSYFTSLFFMYVFTALVHFGSMIFVGEGGDKGPKWECYMIAICTHFFWICSFCWMSAVNFDLWWTFRALRPTSSASKGLKRFLLYVLFCSGIPLTVVGTGIILDHQFGDDLESNIIIPEYAKKTCYMNEQYAPLPYLYGPIAVLLTCNLIFFTVTVHAMYQIHQSTKVATMSSSKNAKQKQSMKLFAKLFLLMGIPWAFEVVSWAISPCGEVAWYWVIFDLINIFQAVAIFFTFVCKSETRNALELKFPAFKRVTMRLSISPDKARSILERRPELKFIIKPLTRSRIDPRGFSSAKTLSTVADARISKI